MSDFMKKEELAEYLNGLIDLYQNNNGLGNFMKYGSFFSRIQKLDLFKILSNEQILEIIINKISEENGEILDNFKVNFLKTFITNIINSALKKENIYKQLKITSENLNLSKDIVNTFKFLENSEKKY